jgi:hypothetical protein
MYQRLHVCTKLLSTKRPAFQPPVRKILAFQLFALVTAMSLLSTGCATFDSLTTKPVPVSANSENGSYTVEMHSTFGKVKPYKGSLSGKSTVSEALSVSGAMKKYRAMDIEILRVVEHEGRNRGLRMAVDYDAATRAVTSHMDYALIDGDRIVVKPASSGSITQVLSSLTGG